jgi:O-antigen/teichoic acid export membrane protein
MVDYLRRVLKGGSYYFIGLIVAGIVAYTSRVVLVRNLAPEDYGLFAAMFTSIAFFLFFRNFGLNISVGKFIPQFKVKKKYSEIKTSVISVLAFQLLVSSLFVVLFWLSADFLALNYFKDPRASFLIRVFSFYFITSIFFKNLSSFFKGFQKNRLQALIEPVKNISILMLIVVFMYFGYGVLAPVLAYVFVGLILLLLFLYPVLKTFNFWKYPFKNLTVFKRMFIFGIPVMMTGVGTKFVSYFDTLMLTYFSGLAEVGAYNIVLPTALLFMLPASAIGAVFMPLISELSARKDFDRVKTGMSLLYKYLYMFSAPIIFSLFIFADILIENLFGSGYLVGTMAFRILLIGVLFNMLSELNNQYLIGTGFPKQVFWVMFFGSILNVVLNLFLIPRYGLSGAAVATSLSYLLMFTISTAKVIGGTKMKLPLFTWSVLVIGLTAFVGVVYFIKALVAWNVWVEGAVSLSIGYVVYLYVLKILGILNVKEIKSFVHRITN